MGSDYCSKNCGICASGGKDKFHDEGILSCSFRVSRPEFEMARIQVSCTRHFD